MGLEDVNGNCIRIARKKFLSLWYTTEEYRKRYIKEIKKKDLVIQPAMSLGHPLVS
jgi:hypothetical protein